MVSQVIKEQSAYSAQFDALQKSAGTEDEPSWLRRLRENAFARFEELGFPTTDQEEWKYTNVASIAKAKFDVAFESTKDSTQIDSAQLQSFTYAEARGSRLVFINGRYSPKLSSVEALPEGAIAMDIRGALKDSKHAE